MRIIKLYNIINYLYTFFSFKHNDEEQTNLLFSKIGKWCIELQKFVRLLAPAQTHHQLFTNNPYPHRSEILASSSQFTGDRFMLLHTQEVKVAFRAP